MVRLKKRSPPSKSSARLRLMTALLLCLLSSFHFRASLPARMVYDISELGLVGLSASCAEIPRNIVRPAISNSHKRQTERDLSRAFPEYGDMGNNMNYRFQQKWSCQVAPNRQTLYGTTQLISIHTRRGRFEDCDVVGGAGEDGPVVVDVVDVHGHREVRHALLQRFVKLRRDLFLRERGKATASLNNQ